MTYTNKQLFVDEENTEMITTFEEFTIEFLGSITGVAFMGAVVAASTALLSF